MDPQKNQSSYFKRNWVWLCIILLLVGWNVWLQFGQPKVYNLSDNSYFDKTNFNKIDQFQLEGLNNLNKGAIDNLGAYLEETSACLDNLKSIKDTSGYVKMELKYTTPDAAAFKVFTMLLNDIELKPCISRDKHTMIAYIKIDPKDTVLNLTSVVRSRPGDFEYSLSIKVFRVTDKKDLLGSFEKTKTIADPYSADVISDKLLIKSRDEKANTTVIAAGSH